MKKTALLLAIILVISLPMSALAAPRALNISPLLRFTGTTAECEVTVVGNMTSDYVEVTMKLMRGNYCEASWSANGYGYVYMYKEDTVTKGRTYNLVVEVKLNGVASSPVSVSGTC